MIRMEKAERKNLEVLFRTRRATSTTFPYQKSFENFEAVSPTFRAMAFVSLNGLLFRTIRFIEYANK